ncbi:MAG: ATP-binding protein [Acidobacteriia bacterium]|nr:ATP-binding protein [Terriglobia bacterium]
MSISCWVAQNPSVIQPMKLNLVGKIKNTQLPRSKALFPMFEAVVNSFEAIEDMNAPDTSRSIEIVVECDDKGLPGIEGSINGFTVIDNGIGFTENNLDAFFTSDTQYKVSRGGKGIGRFIWLKAFHSAEIESHYRENGKLMKRVFKFTMTSDQPNGPATESKEKGPKTTVRLIGMQSPYKENCPQDLRIIGHRLIEHCLPFFLDPMCPKVTIHDGKDHIDLNDYFRETFAAKASKHPFKIRDMTFTLKGLRLYNPYETQHRLIYAANSREVFPERLDKYLPNLQRKLTDEGRPFAYLGFVEGEYLNQHVNGERTNFSFPTDKAIDGMFDEITLDAIRDGALGCVSNDLEPFLEEINTEKRTTINSYITEEAPQYRPLARYLDEFIDRIPPGAKGHALEMALYEQLHAKQRELKQESHKLMEESDETALRPEEYEAKLNSFLERENELGKSSLAQYVIHRKVILEFLERSLQADPETGKYPLEEIIHKIIYPMRTTSDDVPYEQQNLWIIDERLSYHWFLASDMPLDAVRVLENSSESRPDIMIFDRALSFTEDDAALNSLVIIEFKKPDRSNYPKEDPVDQVYRLIREIKGGHFKDKAGREIKVQSERIPAYAYVICDTTKQIEDIAKSKGMLTTPDNLGYYVYNPNFSAYVEIISYAKLLRDAKKRNRILFDKLHLAKNLSNRTETL